MKDRQGNDKGTQYRSGIYYYDESQAEAAHASVKAAPKVLGLKPWQKVYVEVKKAATFFDAEDTHQQYLSEKGGRKGKPQATFKNCCDSIRCYG